MSNCGCKGPFTPHVFGHSFKCIQYSPPPLDGRILCMECGKSVSSPVPFETVVRAWVECPECMEKKLAHPMEER